MDGTIGWTLVFCEPLMKVGDLVKWIGFPGATHPACETGPTEVGIIISIYRRGRFETEDRIDVLWGDSRIGRQLYPETIEVISEII